MSLLMHYPNFYNLGTFQLCRVHLGRKSKMHKSKTSGVKSLPMDYDMDHCIELERRSRPITLVTFNKVTFLF